MREKCQLSRLSEVEDEFYSLLDQVVKCHTSINSTVSLVSIYALPRTEVIYCLLSIKLKEKRQERVKRKEKREE